MKSWIAISFAMALGFSAYAGGITVTVNDSSASSDGADAQTLINELVALGVPVQTTQINSNLTDSSYTLQGMVWSSSAACNNDKQSAVQLQNLESVQQYGTTVLKSIPEVDSGCTDSNQTGAKALDGILAKYMAPNFQPDVGMSQSRYLFQISCSKDQPGNTIYCNVEISNGDNSIPAMD